MINLPLGVISAVLAATTVPETPVARVPLDRAGQVSAVAALGLATAGLILGGASGWGAPATIGLLSAGAVAASCFFLFELSAERHGALPMVPLSFFRRRVRAVATASAGLMGDPAGRMTAVFVIAGVAAVAGIACGVIAIRSAHGEEAASAGEAATPAASGA